MPTGGGVPSDAPSGFRLTESFWREEEGVGGVVMVVCGVQ